VLRLCERDAGPVPVPSFAPVNACEWACIDAAGGLSESRSARRAIEFLRTLFTVAVGVVVGHSVSDPVGVGGSAVLGAGRGGGGTDRRWPLPGGRAAEIVLT
jgi:hypothetical protein